MMKRAFLYARVSTKNHGQDVAVQLEPLRAYAEQRGFEIAGEYTDTGISGTKDRRPGLDKLMQAARGHRVDVILVVRFDRFARSTKHLITALEEFNKLGIAFISLNESIDTSSAMGKMVFTVLGAVAELERNIIVERINAGLAKARRHGVQLGRRQMICDREAIRQGKAAGRTIRELAIEHGVSKSLIANICSERAGDRTRSIKVVNR
jgi:DNA invertase Pin-like site-specific DNA recombinase